MFISHLSDNPVFYFSWVFAVMLSIVLHELGHGIAAIWQGDDTPRILGHMTWDPMVHMGPLSLGMLFLVGISWGLMPVNPSRFRSKYGDAYVSFAGPLVNILLSISALTILGVWYMSAGVETEPGAVKNVQGFFYLLGMTNILLAALNLLPIPPLDGSSVLANFSPSFRGFMRNENNGPIFMGALILVFVLGMKHFWPLAKRAADSYLSLFPVG